MSPSPVQALLADYARIHRHPLNRLCHLLGIPLIILALLGMLGGLPVLHWLGQPFSTAWAGAVALIVVHAVWSLRLGAVVTLFVLLLMLANAWLRQASMLSAAGWAGICGALFVLGWLIQFSGHYFEGAAPRFTRQPAFLWAGMLSMAAALLRLLRIPY